MGSPLRCPWAMDPYSMEYHDHEWGKPSHDDRHLFELLILEGFQAGLSWVTILKKREAFREAFDGFDPAVIAKYDEEKLSSFMKNEKIIRNRLKIAACVANARAFLKVQQEFGNFDTYIWSFTNGIAMDPKWESSQNVPTESELSRTISKDLKKRGFRFVGPTIIYSYLGAIGVINDHLIQCEFR